MNTKTGDDIDQMWWATTVKTDEAKEAKDHVAYAESIGWQCYGNKGDTPEEMLKRGWFDNDDPATLREGPPPFPDAEIRPE